MEVMFLVSVSSVLRIEVRADPIVSEITDFGGGLEDSCPIEDVWWTGGK